MREFARHGIVAGLLAAGLSAALTACMGLAAQAPLAIAAALGIVLALCLAGVKRGLALGLQGVLLALGAAWLLMGGSATVVEILRAATLTFSGLSGAMPMVATETAVLLGVVLGMVSFWATARRAGSYFAVCLVVLGAVILWLTDQPQLLIWLMPAVAGMLLQIMQGAGGEMSLRRSVPLALVLAALALGAAWGGGVTVQPLKDVADDVRQKILDYFFYTEPRNVFSLADEGYYPQGYGQLGGKAEPTDHPVMTVETPRTAYLRGSIRNEYTGRVWLDTVGGKRYLWMHPQWQSERSQVFDMALPVEGTGAADMMTPQRVSIRMLSGSASSLFVPQRVREISVGGDMVPYFGSSSEMFITRDLQEGDTYTVTAPLVMAGDDGLSLVLARCAMQEDPRYAQMVQQYTGLPDHMQEEVRLLAERACAGQETPYGKALALQRYLATDYSYDLDVPPQPENIDFVTHFLLTTREGYCTHFASAMTVMCRMMGLPARYVEGYLAEPDASGTAHVTGLQGHAWTEVYFAGFGWLTFDATPGQGSGQTQPPPETPPEDEPEPTPEPEDQPQPTAAPEPEDASQPEPTPEPEDDRLPEDDEPPKPADEPPPPDLTWLWWLLLVLAIIAALTWRIIHTQPARCAERAGDEMGRWSAWMQAVTDALRVAGLRRGASESPMAFAARVDGLRRFPAELTPLGECMALVFYGRLAPEPEETAMTAQAYAQLLPRLTAFQRLRLTLLRAFVPVRKRDFTR